MSISQVAEESFRSNRAHVPPVLWGGDLRCPCHMKPESWGALPEKVPNSLADSPTTSVVPTVEPGCVLSRTFYKRLSSHYFLGLYPNSLGECEHNMLWKMVVKAGMGWGVWADSEIESLPLWEEPGEGQGIICLSLSTKKGQRPWEGSERTFTVMHLSP